jgi:PKHD-type hydroxylase
MILKHNYFCFKQALSKKFCNDIIKHGNEQNLQKAVTGGLNNLNEKEKEKTLKKIRDSFVCWLGDWWIYRRLHPFFSEANKLTGWNFQYEICEPIQFTKYGKNQHYTWHRDGFEEPYNKNTAGTAVNHIGKTRKLSMVCQLSDPSEYKGGELEFDYSEPDNKKRNICSEIMQQGSLVVFPSFVYHRVRPVTEGTRYSLVVWNLGNSFI